MREPSPTSTARRQCSHWVEVLLQPKIWRRASAFGLPIGLLQVAINQGDHWLRHTVDGTVILKTIVSPLVTLSVAVLSTAGSEVENRRKLSCPETTTSSVVSLSESP